MAGPLGLDPRQLADPGLVWSPRWRTAASLSRPGCAPLARICSSPSTCSSRTTWSRSTSARSLRRPTPFVAHWMSTLAGTRMPPWMRVPSWEASPWASTSWGISAIAHLDANELCCDTLKMNDAKGVIHGDINNYQDVEKLHSMDHYWLQGFPANPSPRKGIAWDTKTPAAQPSGECSGQPGFCSPPPSSWSV